MEYKKYLNKMKKLQNSLLEFIESDEDVEEIYQNLQQIIQNCEIRKNSNEFRSFLHLIHIVSNNHNQTINFYEKFEKIISTFTTEFEKYLSNWEIFSIFKENKRILHFLIDKKILSIDQYITDYFKMNSKLYQEFLINESNQKQTTNSQIKNNGNPGSKILEYCELIQDDNIEDFIIYVNKYNLSITTTINNSSFETNPFLCNKQTSLIEYSAFFGSIQIFNYLYKNQAILTPSLWIYAIHGFNPEIIYILEKEKILPEDQTYKQCLIEAIKCHHNSIVNYLKTNYFENQQNIDDFICKQSIKYYNYSFFSDNLFNGINFFNFCKFDYFYFVNIFIKSKKIDINVVEKDDIDNVSYILTPLLASIKNDNQNIAKLLLKQPEIDINYKCLQCKINDFIKNCNVLYFAINNNNLDLFQFLLKQKNIDTNSLILEKRYLGSRFKVINSYPIFKAIRKQQAEFIKSLLGHPSTNINSIETVKTFSNREQIVERKHILYEAVKIKNIEIIKDLLDNKNIDLNFKSFVIIDKNEYDEPPLLLATRNNDYDIVKMLLMHHDIDINIKGKYNTKLSSTEWNALTIAVLKNYIDIVKLLLSKPKIKINDLLEIYEYNDNFINKSFSCYVKKAALPIAIINKNENIIKLLLQHTKIDVNIKYVYETEKRFDETTNLHLAIRCNCVSAVKLLLSNKSLNVNEKSLIIEDKLNPIEKIEKTALDWAIEGGNVDIFSILLSNKQCNVNMKTFHTILSSSNFFKEEKTVFHLCAKSNNLKIFKVFFDYWQKNGNASKESIQEILSIANDYEIKSLIYEYINSKELK